MGSGNEPGFEGEPERTVPALSCSDNPDEKDRLAASTGKSTEEIPVKE